MSTQEYPLALPVGAVLAGQYTIDKVLGQGGFGITYKATDYNTKAKVAIKEFFPDSLAYRSVTTVVSHPGERTENFQFGKESFLQEAHTLSEFIGCENIVRIHSYFEENGTAYFVMDYVEGTSFDEYIKSKGGKIAYEDAERILLPVMDALAVVHSKGIIHRDVTPDNIFITNEGVVKLLDFGAARYSLGDKSRSLDVILKHGFAPKEQYTRRGKQGTYTDVYSLGATFYFALTGKRPPDSVERIDEDSLVLPSARGIEIPRAKEDAIIKALNVQANERFQSMAEFKSALMGETVPNVNPTPVVEQVFYAPPQQQTATVKQPNQCETLSSQNGSPKKKSKKPLIIAIASIVIFVGVIAMIVGVVSSKTSSNVENKTTEYAGSDDTTQQLSEVTTTRPIETTTSRPQETTTVRPTETTTACPSETTTAVMTSKDNAVIVGNRVGNISNNGLVEGSGDYFIDDNYKSVQHYNGSKYETIITSKQYPISNLIKLGDFLYYICGKQVERYTISTGEIIVVEELKKYKADKMRLYISEDYYFISCFNIGDSYGKLYRVSRKSGQEEQSIQVGHEKQFIFWGENLYYVKDTSEKSFIYMVSSLDFTDVKKSYSAASGMIFNLVTASDGYIYVTMVNSSNAEIVKFDAEFNNVIEQYVLTEECQKIVGNDFWIYTINVIKNQMVITLDGENDRVNKQLCHLTVNEKNYTWEWIAKDDEISDVGIAIIENEYYFLFLMDGIARTTKTDSNGKILN